MGVAIVSGAREPMGVEAMTMQPAEMTDEQLNAAVITEVMGLEVHPVTGHPIVDGKMCAWFGPVTDYAAAFDVVERMREDGWMLTIMDSPDDKITGVRFAKRPVISDARCTHGDEPRAICEAALKAKRNET